MNDLELSYVKNYLLVRSRSHIPVVAFRVHELPDELKSAANEHEPISFFGSEPVYAFVPVLRILKSKRYDIRSIHYAFDALAPHGYKFYKAGEHYKQLIGKWFIYYPGDEELRLLGVDDEVNLKLAVFLDCSSWSLEEKAKIWVVAAGAWFSALACVISGKCSEDDEFIKVILSQRNITCFNPQFWFTKGHLLMLVWLPVYEVFKRTDVFPEEAVEKVKSILEHRLQCKYNKTPSVYLRHKCLSFYAEIVRDQVEKSLKEGGELVLRWSAKAEEIARKSATSA